MPVSCYYHAFRSGQGRHGYRGGSGEWGESWGGRRLRQARSVPDGQETVSDKGPSGKAFPYTTTLCRRRYLFFLFSLYCISICPMLTSNGDETGSVFFPHSFHFHHSDIFHEDFQPAMVETSNGLRRFSTAMIVNHFAIDSVMLSLDSSRVHLAARRGAGDGFIACFLWCQGGLEDGSKLYRQYLKGHETLRFVLFSCCPPVTPSRVDLQISNVMQEGYC